MALGLCSQRLVRSEEDLKQVVSTLAVVIRCEKSWVQLDPMTAARQKKPWCKKYAALRKNDVSSVPQDWALVSLQEKICEVNLMGHGDLGSPILCPTSTAKS